MGAKELRKVNDGLTVVRNYVAIMFPTTFTTYLMNDLFENDSQNIHQPK